jgi:hypothetical protein
MASLDDRSQGIKSFRVTKRINEGVTSFEIEYATPLRPDGLVCGEQVSIDLIDPSSPGETIIVGGRIQKITRNQKDNNKIYSISGRDEGFFLVKNKFGFDCSLNSQTTFKPYDMLLNILEGENITIGGGTPSFDNETTFHTNGNLAGGYCGIWKNKKTAIDNLFDLYAQTMGYNKIRWYIDNENQLRWFETNKTRGNIINFVIEGNTEKIADFTITEDSENIENQISGYACDDSITTTQTNNQSVEQYGLQIGDNVTNSDIDNQGALNTYVANQLKNRAFPIYTATLTFKGLFWMEMGQQIKFVDDPNYNNILLTCTQMVIEGQPADITTTLSFSTDESAIAPPTTTDTTRAIVNDAIQTNKSNLGTIVDVADNDCSQMLVKPYGEDTLVNVKSSNSCANYNVGGITDN